MVRNNGRPLETDAVLLNTGVLTLSVSPLKMYICPRPKCGRTKFGEAN